MFYYLRGKLTVLQNNLAVLDCGGVGYKLTIPASTCSALSSKLKKEALLYTNLAVREDAMELYGFASEEELELFRKLISVSGIGPKGAGSILSVLTAEEFIRACAQGDYKAIAKAPGVGTKTAQRVILELKDKLAKGQTVTAGGETVSGPAVTIIPQNKASEAVAALAVLGYSQAEINVALKGIDTESLALEQIIRLALKNMMKG